MYFATSSIGRFLRRRTRVKSAKAISRQSSCSRTHLDATIRCVLRTATDIAAIALVCIFLGCQSQLPSNGNSAKKRTDCPLVIEEVSFREYAGAQYNTPTRAMLFCEVRNTTEKAVRSAFFEARPGNNLSVPQSFAVPDTSTLRVPPHSTKRFSRPMPLELSRHPVLSVLQVRFDDGTSWRDNGSQLCSHSAD